MGVPGSNMYHVTRDSDWLNYCNYFSCIPCSKNNLSATFNAKHNLSTTMRNKIILIFELNKQYLLGEIKPHNIY